MDYHLWSPRSFTNFPDEKVWSSKAKWMGSTAMPGTKTEHTVSIFRTLLCLILMVTDCTDFVFPLYQLQLYSSTMQWTDYNF